MNNKGIKTETTFNIKDVPQAMLDKVRDTFEKAPQVRQMRVEQNMRQRRGDYIGALAMAKQIEDAYNRTVAALLEEAEKSCHDIKVSAAKLSTETIKTLSELLVTIQLTVDILNMSILDFNSALHKDDPDLDMTAFDDIKELHDRIKMKMDKFYEESEIFHAPKFAEKSDNMYKLLRNKARSILNKKK